MAEGSTLPRADSAMNIIMEFGQAVSQENEEMDKKFAPVRHILNDLDIDSTPGDLSHEYVEALMKCSERLTRYGDSMKKNAICIDKTRFHLMQKNHTQLRESGGRRDTSDSGIYSIDSCILPMESLPVTTDPVQEETEQLKRKQTMMSSPSMTPLALPPHDSESATWNTSEESLSFVHSSTSEDDKETDARGVPGLF